MSKPLFQTLKWALVTASVLPAAALAQEDPSGQRKNKNKPAEEDMIIVYGNGIEENTSATGLDLTPRETPQSISIITREQIDAQAAATVADMLEYTTGVSVKPVDRGRNNLSARGFEITNYQLDGLRIEGADIGPEENNIAIYERVEVIRGSTGLMHGAGEPAALVNMVRKKADSQDFSGIVSLEAGSWNRLSAMLDLSAPLTKDGSVRGRVVGNIYSQKSFMDRESRDGFVIYGTISADLSPSTRLRVGASHQQDNRDGVSWVQLPYWYSDGTRAIWPRSRSHAAEWNFWDTKETSAFASLEQDLGNDWSIRADGNYIKLARESQMIWMTGTPDRFTGAGMTARPYWYNGHGHQWNGNLQIKGKYSLLGRDHELVFGAMYSGGGGPFASRKVIPNDYQPVANFNNWDGKYPYPIWDQDNDWETDSETKSHAFYGVTRFRILDNLKLIAGGRFSYWNQKDENSDGDDKEIDIYKGKSFTPYAGLVLDFNDYLSAYVSYTSIFNPQQEKDRYGDLLDPLQGNSYEAGLKADLINGRLRASAAIFRVEQDNFAVPDKTCLGLNLNTEDPVCYVPAPPDSAIDPEPASFAAQGTVAQGYELEMQGEVTRGWNISVGWSHFRAKDAGGIDVETHQPRKMFRMSTKYDFAGVLDGFAVGGSLRWEGRSPQTARNPGTGLDERVGQPAYLLVNLLTSYKIMENVTLQVNVNNIFDKVYYNTNAYFGGYMYGDPRNVRATLRMKF